MLLQFWVLNVYLNGSCLGQQKTLHISGTLTTSNNVLVSLPSQKFKIIGVFVPRYYWYYCLWNFENLTEPFFWIFTIEVALVFNLFSLKVAALKLKGIYFENVTGYMINSKISVINFTDKLQIDSRTDIVLKNTKILRTSFSMASLKTFFHKQKTDKFPTPANYHFTWEYY